MGVWVGLLVVGRAGEEGFDLLVLAALELGPGHDNVELGAPG